MVKRVLPCPVCGGESFIEAATQGGLICSDCGTVSNQVEVADEDDNAEYAARSNIRTYRYVSEAESKARRERRTRLHMDDRRSPATMIEGLTLILKHMCAKLIESGHINLIAAACIRGLWHELLTTMSIKFTFPMILDNRYSPNKYLTGMLRWGVPDREQQRELVCRDMPSERRRRMHALQAMMDDRNLSYFQIDVVEDGPSYIYMHDWLITFFGLSSVVFPNSLLTSCNGSLSLDDVLSAKSKIQFMSDLKHASIKEEEITTQYRRKLVRDVFFSIMNNENLRKDFFNHHSISYPSVEPPTVVNLDMTTLLALIILGIRNSGGGVLPIHVLDWITRNELPFFSAHKCLPPEIDRIEYYWLATRQCAYATSFFMPEVLPTAETLEAVIEKISKDVPVAMKPNNVVGLIENVLDFLGLSPLVPFASQLATMTTYGMITSGMPLVKPCTSFRMRAMRMRRSKVQMKPYQDIFFGDLSRGEFVALVVMVVIKMVCPDLHVGEEDVEVDELEEIVAQVDGFRYVVRHMARKRKAGEFLTKNHWDSLSKDEQDGLLEFCEKDRFEELRPCVVEDLRMGLDGGEQPSDMKKPQPFSLTLGKINSYTFTPRHLDEESIVLALLLDVMEASGVPESHAQRMHRALGEFERTLLLTPPIKFVRRYAYGKRSPYPRKKKGGVTEGAERGARTEVETSQVTEEDIGASQGTATDQATSEGSGTDQAASESGTSLDESVGANESGMESDDE